MCIRDSPEVLLLAGFDPLLLGYGKREDPLLPEAYRTRVYRPGGMLLSSVLLQMCIRDSPSSVPATPWRGTR